jgi:hypothetical protein
LAPRPDRLILSDNVFPCYPVNPTLHKGAIMADDSHGLEFEDIPLEDARRMGRGPRMEPLLYDTLRTKIQALSTEATRIRLGPEIQPARSPATASISSTSARSR